MVVLSFDKGLSIYLFMYILYLSQLIILEIQDSNFPSRLDNIPEVIAALTEFSTTPSTLYKGYPNNIDGGVLDSNYIANKTNDDGKEEVTFGPHTHDIVSQRLVFVSEPEFMPIFSSMSGPLMPSLISDDVIRSIMLAGY
ncbi:hypothetical protein NC652_037370 [Populus alba x Populus x berolinensis]|nr:hypothetical protein NC652_037370 [Populus alba x Populus x berolinensis]